MKTRNQNAANWIDLLLDVRLLEQESYQPVGGMVQLANALRTACLSRCVFFDN